MAMYSMSFGFRQPYQILGQTTLFDYFYSQLKVVVDSEMCKTAHNGNMDLRNLLATVLQGTVKPSAFYLLSFSVRIRLNRSCQVK